MRSHDVLKYKLGRQGGADVERSVFTAILLFVSYHGYVFAKYGNIQPAKLPNAVRFTGIAIMVVCFAMFLVGGVLHYRAH